MGPNFDDYPGLQQKGEWAQYVQTPIVILKHFLSTERAPL